MTLSISSTPLPNRLAIKLEPRAERAVKRGHPWVFAHGIKQQRKEGRSGDLAVLFDRDNRFLGIGLYDPDSPIRVRVLHHGSPTTIDPEWFAERVRLAHELRLPLLQTGTDGYRVIHGENDQMPGLVADRYGDSLVVKLYTASWIPHLGWVLESLQSLLAPERIILRASRAVQKQPSDLFGLGDGQVLSGTATSAPVLFRENGLIFEADLIGGQKTGFFLDQRDNRRRVERLCEGRSVLNVFAYTGGFSVYAARGGAREVTSLDISAPALRAAERNFAHNQHVEPVSAAVHHRLRGDAFKRMAELAGQGTRYDVVILDPPSFAKAKDEIDGAMRSYRKLTRLALGILSPGGTLVAASCSSRVGAESFARAVTDSAGDAGRPLRILEQTGHAIDHPISFPEAAYLNCIFATAP
ncbi:MAG: class I SAM-dependent rRNA methyltransferase [Gemmatimonadota bacterium]